MKRTMNRLFLRVIMLCVAIILGAFAVAHAQKGLDAVPTAQLNPQAIEQPRQTQPIPPSQFAGVQGTNVSNVPGIEDSRPGSIVVPQGGFDDENQGAPIAESVQRVRELAPPIETPQPNAAMELAYNDPPQLPAPALPLPQAQPAYGDEYAPADGDQGPVDDQEYVPGYDESDYGDVDDYQGGYAPSDAGPSDYPEEELQLPEADNQQPMPNYGGVAPADLDSFGEQPVDQVQYLSEENGEGNSVRPLTTPAVQQRGGESPFAAAPPQTTPTPAPQLSPLPEQQPAPATEQPSLPPINNLPVTPSNTGSEYSIEPSAPAPMLPPAEQIYTGGTGQSQPPSNPYGAPVGQDAYGQQPQSRIPAGKASLRMANNGDNRFAGTPIRNESPGTGKPGAVELEGTQTPTLQITKSATPEIQVGKPAKFQVTVRNIGAVDARDVLIRDQIPHGTRLIGTKPEAGKMPDGGIMWQMGTISSGSEVTVTMEVMPTLEGDIGSVATVSFQAAASAKSLATRPQLTIEHNGPGEVLVGEDVIFNIKLSNPGTGIAYNVRLEEDVPQGLRHIDGSELEYNVGTIRPGETRLLELTLKADMPGQVNNLLVARADSNLEAKDNCLVNIVAPKLAVAIKGPRKRYLERRANFEIDIQNPGTAAAKNVELVARLPKGLKFVSTNSAGQYNPAEHAVHWLVEELPAQRSGGVSLVTVPIGIGSQQIRVESKANMGLADNATHDINVEGMAALLFTVTDAVDPIEVGGQTTYEVHILNQGSKTGTNLRLVANLDGMVPISGEGPTRATVNGTEVVFEPLARLAPQADTLYKIHVKGVTPGDRRIRVQLMSDDISQPVTKEESTHIYSDE